MVILKKNPEKVDLYLISTIELFNLINKTILVLHQAIGKHCADTKAKKAFFFHFFKICLQTAHLKI